MLVKDITDFIGELNQSELILRDHSHLQDISRRFNTRNSITELTKDDLSFLVALYKCRWIEIRETDYNYSINPDLYNNMFWIDLSKKLATALQLDYLTILRPGLDVHETPHTLDADVPEQEAAYELLCCLLVVLLKHNRFGSFFSSGETISLWDISNFVPSNVKNLYDRIFDLVKTKKHGDYQAFYETMSFQSGDISCLTAVIKEKKFSEIGVYWFSSQAIFAELLHFQTDGALKDKISIFLDAVINTYFNDNTDFIKQLRINILFAKLLSSFPLVQQRALIDLLEHCDKSEAQKNFIANCNTHIHQKFLTLGYTVPSSQETPTFFSSLIKARAPDNVSDLLALLRFYDDLTKDHLNDGIANALRRYIAGLENPILTVSEARVGSASESDTHQAGAFPSSW